MYFRGNLYRDWLYDYPSAVWVGARRDRGDLQHHPYVGPYFGIFPSLLVAIAQSPEQVISVIIVVLIVQQVDGNLIYPNVIGKSLQIHPLTIIILLLVAGKLAGILGMILAVPTYAIVKVLINFIHHIWFRPR